MAVKPNDPRRTSGEGAPCRWSARVGGPRGQVAGPTRIVITLIALSLSYTI